MAESHVGIAQLMGLRIFFPTAATFGSPAGEVRRDWLRVHWFALLCQSLHRDWAGAGVVLPLYSLIVI